MLFFPQQDITTVEALSKPIHRLLTDIGNKMFSLQPGVVNFSDFHNQIYSSRIKVFQSPEAINIMNNQGRFTSQDYIDNSERSSARNRRHMQFIATGRGLTTDSIKSLLYPTQLFEDAMYRIEGIRTHLLSSKTLHLKNSRQNQKELQTLLLSGKDFVGKHISLIADFRDSQPYLKGTPQDALYQSYLGRLVEAHNELSDMGNQMYKTFGRPLTVPPRGRIVISLDATSRCRRV